MKPTERRRRTATDPAARRCTTRASHTTTSDVNVRAILGFAGIVAVVTIVCAVIVWGLFNVLEQPGGRRATRRCRRWRCRRRSMPRTHRGVAVSSATRRRRSSITDEPAVLRMLRESEDKTLHEYGWVDEKAGVARRAHRSGEEAARRARPAGARRGQRRRRSGTHAPAFGEASGGRAIPTGERPAAPPPATAAGARRHRAEQPAHATGGPRGRGLIAGTREGTIVSFFSRGGGVAGGRASVGRRPCWRRGSRPRRSIRRPPSPACSAKIGLDQRIGESIPLDLPFIDESGRQVALRAVLRQAPGDPRAGVLRVPDALHPGAERGGVGGGHPELRGRPRVRRGRRQLQPEGRARARGAEEGRLSRALRAAAVGGRLALPDRHAGARSTA